ncbi:MAG: hypothetical protein QXT13_12810, partial [Pyrobaculum sp.]
MFSYLTEWGEQIIKFVLLFNLIYALVATAWYGATGLGSPYMPDWLSKQVDKVEVTNNPMQIPNAVQMMLTFTVAFATGLVQIVQLFQYILPPWLYAPLFTIALFLQTVALMYIAYRVFQLIRSLLSPFAPMSSLTLPLAALLLASALNSVWFDNLIPVLIIPDRGQNSYDTFLIIASSGADDINRGILYINTGNSNVTIRFPFRWRGVYEFDIQLFFPNTGAYPMSCDFALRQGYNTTIAMTRFGNLSGIYINGTSRMRTILSQNNIFTSMFANRTFYISYGYRCDSYGIDIIGNPFIVVSHIPNTLVVNFTRPLRIPVYHDNGSRRYVTTQYNWDYVIHAQYKLVNNFTNTNRAFLNMYMLVYQDINGSVYEFVVTKLTDMFFRFRLYARRGDPRYFFMYYGQISRMISIDKFTVYLRQLNKSEFQGFGIHTLGHPRAQLRVAIDYYRCEIVNRTHSGLGFSHTGIHDLLLSLGGKPVGIGLSLPFTVRNLRDPYMDLSPFHDFCNTYSDVQQSFYIMYNPGDWLVSRERYSVYNYTLGRNVEWLRFALIELPRQCPTMLWLPANRIAYTENPRRYVAETSNNTKLRPLLFVRNATWVPLDSSSYYVVAVAHDWGGARQITYAGYGGVLVGN